MRTKNNGGPAFPCEVVAKNDGLVHEGMTMRDYFAAKALLGALGDSSFHYDNEEKLSRWCYRIADAMLAAREAS